MTRDEPSFGAAPQRPPAPTSWRVRALGTGGSRPDAPEPGLPARRRPPPKPAPPLVVGYVPTTAHAHRPSPQIPPRRNPLPPYPPLPRRRPLAPRAPASQPAAPSPPPRRHGHATLEDADPVEGFLEALRRHLSGHDEPVATSSVDPPDTSAPPARGSEHGDRGRFLAAARERLTGRASPTMGQPPPPLDPDPDVPVPEPTYGNVDPEDLVGSFVRAVEAAGGHCHQVTGSVPDSLLDRLVAELGAWDVVVSAEPEAVALGERLAARGVEVGRATPAAAARATVGVTSAVAGIAATGSVVLDSRRAGGRVASLLPAVHLCVLPVDRLVAAPGDVLRPLGSDPAALPPTLVLETGRSQTGDIEHLLTEGVHGPTRLHVILVT